MHRVGAKAAIDGIQGRHQLAGLSALTCGKKMELFGSALGQFQENDPGLVMRLSFLEKLIRCLDRRIHDHTAVIGERLQFDQPLFPPAVPFLHQMDEHDHRFGETILLTQFLTRTFCILTDRLTQLHPVVDFVGDGSAANNLLFRLGLLIQVHAGFAIFAKVFVEAIPTQLGMPTH